MDDYLPTPDRTYASPSAQRRTGEIWKARLGLSFVIGLTAVSAALMLRLAAIGVGAASSPFQAAPTTTPFVARSVPVVFPSPTAVPSAPNAPTTVPGAPNAPTVAPSAPNTPTRVPTTVPATGREHTIASGDTLLALANRYGTTVDAIVKANNFTSKDVVLQIGQKIKLP